MIQVSEQWKLNQTKKIVSQSDIRISLSVGDDSAMSQANAASEDEIFFSKVNKIVSGIENKITKYNTLEKNIWVLDDSGTILPDDDFEDGGYTSESMSDEFKNFNTPIDIYINFSSVQSNSIPAITITWSETYSEFASDFSVVVMNGSNTVFSKEVTDNKDIVSIVLGNISNYDSIKISIKKWCLPFRRARIKQIFTGMIKNYSKKDIMSFSNSGSIDALSMSLPTNNISFSLKNIDNSFNPYIPDSLSNYLMQRQPVNISYGYIYNSDQPVEWIKVGTFYLSEWEAKQNDISASFSASNLFEFFQDEYTEGKYNPDGVSLYQLAENIFESVELPLNSDGSQKWYIDDSLKNIFTTAPLPEDTKANCLQLIANAGMCVIYPDFSGVIRIEPKDYSLKDYEINSFNSYSKPELSLSTPVKQIDVKYYIYSSDEESEERKITIKSQSAEGNTLTIDNPLIDSLERARLIGEWANNYYKLRKNLSFEWRSDPRIEVGDVVSNRNMYENNKVLITELNMAYNGAFKASGEGVVIDDMD